jgi:hypothetical protein
MLMAMGDKTDTGKLLARMPEAPAEIAASLRAFAESARTLSESHGRLLDRYPDRWVAVSHGAVRADGDSLEEVLDKLDRAGIPRSDAIVRLIEREPRTLIL